MATWATPRQEVTASNRYCSLRGCPTWISLANLHRLVIVIVVVVLGVMSRAMFVVVVNVIVAATIAATVGPAVVRAMVGRRGVIRLIVVTTAQREGDDAARDAEQTFHFHGENLSDSLEKARRSKAERCSTIRGKFSEKRGGGRRHPGYSS